MKHDILVEGLAYCLRPIGLEDAEFALSLRTDPELSRFINATSPDVEDQKQWLLGYFERPGDYYWVIESKSGEREGLIAIYDVNESTRAAEWGRWIVSHGLTAAAESALLIYTAGFERLRLDSVYCRTPAANERVVSFHTSCGLETRGVLPGHFQKGGRAYDSIEQVLTRERWPQTRERLTPLVARLAKKRGTYA